MSYGGEIESGRVAFAHLIRVWHARNGWSHRVLPALAEALSLGRVHNSQLSMLRNGKLASPGPEVFLALGGINRWLAEQAPAGKLPREQGERLGGREAGPRTDGGDKGWREGDRVACSSMRARTQVGGRAGG